MAQPHQKGGSRNIDGAFNNDDGWIYGGGEDVNDSRGDDSDDSSELSSIYEPLDGLEAEEMIDMARSRRERLAGCLARERRRHHRQVEEAFEVAGRSMRRQTNHEAEAEYRSLRDSFVPGLPSLAAQFEGRASSTMSGISVDTGNLDCSSSESAAPERGCSKTLQRARQRQNLYNPFREFANRQSSSSGTNRGLSDCRSPSPGIDEGAHNNRSNASGIDLNIRQQQTQENPNLNSSENSRPSLSREFNAGVVGERAPELEFRTNSERLNPDLGSVSTASYNQDLDQPTSGIEENLQRASRLSAVELLENLSNWKHPAAEQGGRNISLSVESRRKGKARLQAGTAAIESSKPKFGNRDFLNSPEATASVFKAVRSGVRGARPRTSGPGITRNQGPSSMRAPTPSHPRGQSSTSTLRSNHGPIPPPMTEYSERTERNPIGNAYNPAPLASEPKNDAAEEQQQPNRPATPVAILREEPIWERVANEDGLLKTYNMRHLHEHISNNFPGSMDNLSITNQAGWQTSIGNMYSWLTQMVGGERWNDVVFMNRSEYDELTGSIIDTAHSILRSRCVNQHGDISHQRHNTTLKDGIQKLRSRIADLEGRKILQEAAIQNVSTSASPRPSGYSDFGTVGRPGNVNDQTEGVATRLGGRKLNSSPLLSNPKPIEVSTVVEDEHSSAGEIKTENMHLRGGQAGIYEGTSDGEDDDEEDEEDARPNYSVPAQWDTRATHVQQRTGVVTDTASGRSTTSGLRTIFDGPRPKFDAYAKFNHAQDEYTLARHRPDPAPTMAESTSNTKSVGDRRPYSVYSCDNESEDGRSQTKRANNTPLAATFRSSSVCTSFDEGSDASTLLRAPNTRFPTPSTVTELDPKMENPELDIEPGVRENFLTISEMYDAQLGTTGGRNNALSIKNIFSREATSVFIPKIDERVKDLDRYGNRIGNVKKSGEVKKSLKERHLELVRERDEQMLRATAEVRAWRAMDPEERAERLAILRNPVDLWHGEAGAAPEDNLEFDEIPHVYTNTVSTREIEAWMQRTVISEADENDQNFMFLTDEDEDTVYMEGVHIKPSPSNGSQLDSHEEFGSRSPHKNALPPRTQPSDKKRRSQKQIDRLASDLLAVDLNRSSCSRYVSSSRRHREISQSYFNSNQSYSDSIQSYSSHPVTTDLDLLDDSLIFPLIEDISTDPSQEITSEEVLNGIDHYCKNAYTKARSVVVQLNPLVHFTPAAITKRVFGGVIQQIIFYEAKKKAIIIFMHCAEAKAFVNHIKKVKKFGTAQEKRALQINANWYKGSETRSICSPQKNIVKYYFSSKATRVLILHNIPITKKKEEVNMELGIRLNQLLVAVCLVSPQQNYLKKQNGKAAIIEFTSIKNAIEARQAIMDGKVKGYGNTNPGFAPDPAGNPDVLREYCHCKGCNDRRDAAF